MVKKMHFFEILYEMWKIMYFCNHLKSYYYHYKFVNYDSCNSLYFSNNINLYASC